MSFSHLIQSGLAHREVFDLQSILVWLQLVEDVSHPSWSQRHVVLQHGGVSVLRVEKRVRRWRLNSAWVERRFDWWQTHVKPPQPAGHYAKQWCNIMKNIIAFSLRSTTFNSRRVTFLYNFYHQIKFTESYKKHYSYLNKVNTAIYAILSIKYCNYDTT